MAVTVSYCLPATVFFCLKRVKSVLRYFHFNEKSSVGLSNDTEECVRRLSEYLTIELEVK